MKVLFVFGGNRSDLYKENYSGKDAISFYIREQAEELKKRGIHIDFFAYQQKGGIDYLKKTFRLRSILKEGSHDIVHAHYGLFGIVFTIIRRPKKVITFHGSDINSPILRIISSFISLFADYRIIVTEKLYNKMLIPSRRNYMILPCGVDNKIFFPIERYAAREKLGINQNKFIILFPSAFSNKIKNFVLAKETLNDIGFEFELFELKGYSREEVNYLLNACNMILFTSKSEGSPQVIKEALFTNTPVVTVDVGDVSEILNGVINTYVVKADLDAIRNAVKSLHSLGFVNTNGFSKAQQYSNNTVADRITRIYSELINGVIL